MKFTELTVHTSAEGSELVADLLWDYSHYGVAISDVRDVVALTESRVAHYDYIDDELLQGGRDVLVKGYIPLDVTESAVREIESRLASFRAIGEIAMGSLELVMRTVDGDDWIEIWKKHFRPIPLGKVTVVPEWIAYDKKEGETVLRIDSNMAFGTGEHETTSMCVELLQDYVTENSTVIDVGCGSGILGISSVLLGAKKAIMTDIDYVAVQSATHNALLNGVADRCSAHLANLLDDTDVKGDVMLANITAEILMGLAGSIPKNLERGGILILSGIIHAKLQAVISAFENAGLTLIKQRAKGEWNAVVMRRN